MLEDIVVYTMALRVGQGAIKGSGYITAGVNCAIDSRAGLCCYNVSTDTDEYVATVVGEGNTGARLEGTDWDITLRYAVSFPDWVYLFECNNMGGWRRGDTNTLQRFALRLSLVSMALLWNTANADMRGMPIAIPYESPCDQNAHIGTSCYVPVPSQCIYECHIPDVCLLWKM